MTNFNEDDKRFEQLVCRMEPHGKLLSVREMTGGVSARVTAIEMVLDSGQIATRIVRRHGEADLKRNPGIAAAEFKLLQVLRSERLPVPEPYYLDESCSIFPQPYLVIGYVEGETDLEPANIETYLLQMAENLAAIHQVDCPSQRLPFLTRQEELAAEILDQDSVQTDDSLNVSRIRETLTAVWPLKQTNQTALLHGDYWPGNILWKDGRLAAIIDWEDTALGDPLADLANARLEMLFHFGIDAMNAFTRQYRSLMTGIDFSNLPYWDLYAALRLSKFTEWGLGPDTMETMRERHRWFVTESLHIMK
ncbi:phosphotransferase family protein [Paenibacillus sabinae]|uniref:Aminoglycoside phosphotransferase domain-containing protein n=1 Tax=Paenibacillus sabinae T27 TaxID=1268072 RepID=X4ZF40_9BACL|nr:phosphotransferase family protein [Paenibacillus sabinae]AHV98156.1 hypothetical protein PSAB_16245 [Paenibacillus sabinae T27]